MKVIKNQGFVCVHKFTCHNFKRLILDVNTNNLIVFRIKLFVCATKYR